jgi:hypothetical protein
MTIAASSSLIVGHPWPASCGRRDVRHDLGAHLSQPELAALLLTRVGYPQAAASAGTSCGTSRPVDPHRLLDLIVGEAGGGGSSLARR